MRDVQFVLRAALLLAVAFWGAAGGEARASAHRMFEEEAILAARRASSQSSSGERARWDESNDPEDWTAPYVYELDKLPAEGAMSDHTPWSDTYWPSKLAGIAARWNWPGTDGFHYPLYAEAEIKAMQPEALARLSPAEKYDIYMGRFDYPTVTEVRSQTQPDAQDWEGICHGWAPAALNHAEPAAVTVTGPSGIAVPFGSADVKALLDRYYAENSEASAFLGLRCDFSKGGTDRGRSECEDVNAGAFHVILANELGLRQKGFVADIDRWREVWNQPVYRFRSSLRATRSPSARAAIGTVKEVVVHTELEYTDEIDPPSWQPVVGTAAFSRGVAKYDYALEIDSAGRIIGGEWISSVRPDFLWSAERLEFEGYFSELSKVYQPATH